MDTTDRRRETARDCGGRKQRSPSGKLVSRVVPRCPGTHYSLIEQEERGQFLPDLPEFEIKGKMEERTGWRGQNESQIVREEKKNGRLGGAAETSKERAEWRRLQRKNWNILGLPKKIEWPQCHRESSWQVRRGHPCQNEKEQSRLSKAPDHERGESQDEREPHLGEKEGDQSEGMEWEGWTPP